jgi:hypothetical protein
VLAQTLGNRRVSAPSTTYGPEGRTVSLVPQGRNEKAPDCANSRGPSPDREVAPRPDRKAHRSASSCETAPGLSQERR